MPSSELSYDGIITDVKSIYQKSQEQLMISLMLILKMMKMNMIEIINPLCLQKTICCWGIVGGGNHGNSSNANSGTNLAAFREQLSNNNNNENAIDSDDDSDDEMRDDDEEEDQGRGPEPFGADEMEL